MAVLQETKAEKKGHISYTNEYRILRYLREKRLRFFRAADVAKAVNLTSNEVASYLRDTPGVRVFSDRKYSRKESGVLWEFVEPGWQ